MDGGETAYTYADAQPGDSRRLPVGGGPRELLRRPALWLGAAIATLPALLWQAQYGWPQLALAPVLAREGGLIGGRWTFLPLMLMAAGVGIGVVLFCYGLWRLLRSPELRPYRFLGWAFLGLAASFLITGGHSYYAAGMFPVCWAAGAVELQRRTPAPRWWRWILSWPVYALSAIIALTSLPILPVSWATLATPTSLASLGFPELTDTVAGAYRALPPVVRSNTVVVTAWYWDAAAIDRLGPVRGMPRVYSPNRGYWYFGSPPEEAGTVLFVGSDAAYLHRYFTEVNQVATVTAGPAINLTSLPTPVWFCAGRKAPWAHLWAQLRHL